MDPVENYRSTMPEAVVRDWAQDAQKELVSLRARIDKLSRAYAVQGLAIEELTSERDEARARVAELEEGISTAMQLIEGGFDSAAYEALEALNAHK